MLLGLSALAGATGLTYVGSLAACRLIPRRRQGFFALLDDLPNADVIRNSGARTARALGLSNAGRIADHLLARKPVLRAAVKQTCPQTRLAMIQGQCCEDFAAGQFVTVDGWVLSETEAGLSAAAWLERSGSA
jgi:hypothetical protein